MAAGMLVRISGLERHDARGDGSGGENGGEDSCCGVPDHEDLSGGHPREESTHHSPVTPLGRGQRPLLEIRSPRLVGALPTRRRQRGRPWCCSPHAPSDERPTGRRPERPLRTGGVSAGLERLKEAVDLIRRS